MTNEQEQLITKTVERLLQELGISGTFTLAEAEGSVDVLLQTEESGMVIGYHGETLEALQFLLSLMVAKQLGEFVRISVEVGDYKKNRSEYLERLAMQVKERVLAEHREHALPALKAWERRVVHMILQNDDSVTSESVGEGKERILVVKPKA